MKSLHLAVLSIALILPALTCSLHVERDLDSPLPTAPVPGTSISEADPARKLMVALEIPQMEDDNAVEVVTATFDAFLYGHPLSSESSVAALKAAGLEDWRYFNIFHVDRRYPQWGGFFGDLYGRLEDIDGWIPGVHYRFYGGPLGYDYIVDHTRPEVTKTVSEVVAAWADTVDAKNLLLDLTFADLQDWWLLDGEDWPWPEAEHAERNRRWGRNMQDLIDRASRTHRAATNAGYELASRVIFFENQPWMHRRGRFSWRQLIDRVMHDGVVPILHVGHDTIHTSAETTAGEEMTLAVWLLAPRAYLLVEYEYRPLVFAGRVIERRLQLFEPDGPAVEAAPGVWWRGGTIEGEPWEVKVNALVGWGEISRVTRR